MISNSYNNVFFVESFLFTIVSLKIIDFFQLNDYIKLFFSSIDIAFIRYIKYMIFIVALFSIYAAICLIIFGPFSADFDTFGEAFIKLLLISMGYYDAYKVILFNAGWGVTIILSFFLFVVVFMFVVFISIYAESLRSAVVKLGYPDDVDLNEWILKDYIVWLCYCINLNGEEEKDDDN